MQSLFFFLFAFCWKTTMNPISFKITTQSKAPPKTRPQQLFSNDDEIVTESTKPRIDPKAEGVAFAGKGSLQFPSQFLSTHFFQVNFRKLFQVLALVCSFPQTTMNCTKCKLKVSLFNNFFLSSEAFFFSPVGNWRDL